MKQITEDNYLDVHYVHKSNWLRAAVLGANDGIISLACLAVSVASANASDTNVLIATFGGLVAGALSMAAGEYVSVSSQKDIENADIERERKELETDPAGELKILTHIYKKRGLTAETAAQVARELTERNAIEAHLRDELCITELTTVKPLQAAFASGAAFCAGGILPLIVILLCPHIYVTKALYAVSILCLMILGMVSAKIGGARMIPAMLRISIWGSIAMGVSASIGYMLGIAL